MRIQYKKTVVLTLESGKKLNCDYLGQGQFATAWKHKRTVYLVMKDGSLDGLDYGKDVTADTWRACGRNARRYLPNVERLEHLDNGNRVYRMPFYEKLTAKHKTAWAEMKALQSAREQAARDTRDIFRDSVGFNQRILENVKKANVSKSLVAAIRELVDSCCNYGSGYSLEFNKANLGVDKQGHLVLRDVVFDLDVVKQYYNRRLKRAA